jgi:hypothetical protein
VRSTGSTAQRLALVRDELKTAPQYSDARKRLLVEEAQLVKQLSTERASSSRSAQSDAVAAAKAQDAAMVAQRDALRRVEDMQQTHYDKLRAMSDDYALSSSRRLEDYNEARQLLLANGQIKEAQLLEAKYNKEKARADEDNDIARRKETESAAKGISDAQIAAGVKADDRARRAALGGVSVTGGSPLPVDMSGYSALQANADAARAAPVAADRGIDLRISIAPTQVAIDGGKIVEIIWPEISQRVDTDLSNALVTAAFTAAPGSGQGNGVGGPSI